ncbi:oxidoreductase [Streptomyces leeuwenhoekii]|uniref:Oxidoreductase n=1 Tax=Streptomyces leeuwenhoekii TaxID=1437453 RepID=A0ABR5HS73_STRLW|nr:Gfo/Idh/MocA family oxidoreductase [Streptomyces leeuwenhoekii]KMS69592.1 oxidoreductase [Streptomyces leeuwenhoekii]
MKVAVLSFADERAEPWARLLRDLPGVDLVTADPDGPPDDPRRGPVVAARLGVPYLDGYDAVFAARPQAVVVTGETDRRRELVERAAEAGAQVLCPHPPADAEEDAQAMVDACTKAAVRLTVASPACFGEAFATARRGLAEGVVGTLTTVHGAYHGQPPATADDDAGALAARAPYLLDLVDAVFDGEPAAQVYAQANSVLGGRPGAESAALLTVRYPSGRVAALDCSRTPDPHPGGPALTFVGDRASLEYDARPRLLGGHDATTGAERWEPGGDDLDAAMLRAFLATADGAPGTGPDGAAALRALRIVRAARTSARTGRPVELR